MARRSKLACPHAEDPVLSIQRTDSVTTVWWVTRHSRGEVDKGEKSPSREMTGENAIEGLDW